MEQVLCRSGKVEELTSSHRPYGSSKVSLGEIRRIRDAGGWVCFSVLGLALTCLILCNAVLFFQ